MLLQMHTNCHCNRAQPCDPEPSVYHLPLCVVQWLLSLRCEVLVQQRPHALQPVSRLYKQLWVEPPPWGVYHIQVKVGIKLHLDRNSEQQQGRQAAFVGSNT